MTTASSFHLPDRHAGAARLFVAEGVMLIALGSAAVLFPILAGVATATLFGWILTASGVFGLISAFSARPHMHFWWSVASSILAIAAGVVIAFSPAVGALTLVWVVAVWLALDGASTLMIGLDRRRAGTPSWGWLVLSAIVDWLLAAALLFLSPVSGLIAVATIGVVVGIDLFLGGLALALFGLRQRHAVA
jgi:uncharacterized membrane protein HdeD (DUF308 family)